MSSSSPALRLIGPVLLIAVAIAAVAALMAMNSPVRVVRVEADLSAAERSEVRGAIDRLVGQGMLTLDLDEVVDTMRGLAWPRLVAVRRDWPDGLIVQLVRESFVAQWGDDGALNGAGEVFRDVVLTGNLPSLRTHQSNPARAMQIFQMLQGVLNPSGVSIAALEEDDGGEWHVELDDGLTVVLGRKDLAARLGRYLAVHRDVLRGRAAEIGWIDARYRNGIAVRWRSSMEQVARN